MTQYINDQVRERTDGVVGPRGIYVSRERNRILATDVGV